MPVRRITTTGSVFVLDHETFGPNEKKTVPVFGDAIVNTDGIGSELLEMEVRAGGEIRVELKLNVSADSSLIARVNGVAKLFEGDDEGTQDLEDERGIIKQVLPNEPRDIEVHLINSGFGGGDKADIKLNLTNAAADPVMTTAAGSVGLLPKQDLWRWCHKCKGLWFSGADSVGRCPVDGGHSLNGSGNYALVDGTNFPGGQPKWRWCHRCMGLWFSGAGFGAFGHCPAGGGHSLDGSGNYVLTGAPDVGGQRNWRWCHLCMGLHFIGAGQGRCPTGGGHSLQGSGDYVLTEQ